MNDSAILEFQSFDLDSPSREASLIDIGSSSKGRLSRASHRAESPAKEDHSRPNSQSFWTFEYYQQFFDVNTDEVKERLLWSMVPRLRKNFLEDYIKPNPDLYGPVWVSTTLIFVLAVTGNIALYLHNELKEGQHYHYQYRLISYTASAILSYISLVPFGLWLIMKWSQTDMPLSFLELLCTYGYSLSIFVPASILSTIQLSWFQWAVIFIAASMSVFVLVSSVVPSVKGPRKLPVIGAVICLHYLLAGFILYTVLASTPDSAPALLSGDSLLPRLNSSAPQPPMVAQHSNITHAT